ncbi:MAG: FtsX-like permease family protein [Luteitalea sp.]|nr:FtsX-like permease family protein [Luteitalea sp.]
MGEAMTFSTLARRAFVYYRQTNAAVVLGMACAVAVLSGALLVGESVRESLRELSVGRLGQTDLLVTSERFFREQLATDVDPQGAVAVPVVVVDGLVSDERSEQRSSRVEVFGVDRRFWRFHGVEAPALDASDAWVSPGLARELALVQDDPLLIRTRKPSAIPGEFLHGRRDEVGRTMRMRAAGILERAQLGEFSLKPQQDDVRAVFLPLERLQRDLEQQGRVNAILINCPEPSESSADCARPVRQHATLEDLGLVVRPVASGTALSLESRSGLLAERVARAATESASASGHHASPLLTYVANAIRYGDREVPYSLVTALDERDIFRAAEASESRLRRPPLLSSDVATGAVPDIVVNTWAARALGVSGGERVALEYYVWEGSGRLDTRAADFRVAAVVPITAADRDFAPNYEGISDATSVAEWEPPFPVDLGKIRPADEEYWERYRTTPKAFVPLEAGQQLWGSRYGQLTAVRVQLAAGANVQAAREQFQRALRAKLDPLASGLVVLPVREQALRASVGATDFGEYFTYFSFFLVVAALLLAALFFRLGIEQRIQQVGVLRAVGYSSAAVRRLFLLESVGLALAGGVLGMFGALAYAWLIMFGLRTWWVGAVGTTLLELHPSLLTLGAGALGGLLIGVAVIWWTLRSLRRTAPRALLTGDVASAFGGRSPRSSGRLRLAAGALGVGAVALAAASAAGLIGETAGFFGAGTLLLAAALSAFSAYLARGKGSETAWAVDERIGPKTGTVPVFAPYSVPRLGIGYAGWRRGRSVLSAALIASAVFLIVSVEAFRREGTADAADKRSGTGGYALIAESLLPLFHDPEAPEGRDALNLIPDSSSDPHASFSLTRLRLRSGDDASCVNLYRPQRPRVVGAPAAFIDSGRFAFGATTASTDEERRNPWVLLRRRDAGGAVPAIADATSLQYVLHASVGDELVIDEGTNPIRLRIVAALADSALQGELIIDERRFLELFPDEEGYRFFLIDVESTPAGSSAGAAAVTSFLEGRLDDFGFDVSSTTERLAAFHRVENTYLSTFQALGALGLLLGTIGLAAVAVRNVLERRRELALLRAIGYRRRDLTTMIVAENAMLLGVGLGAGVAAALVAVAPVALERGGRLPLLSLTALVLAVIAAGLLSSVAAARVSARAPLLAALRSE